MYENINLSSEPHTTDALHAHYSLYLTWLIMIVNYVHVYLYTVFSVVGKEKKKKNLWSDKNITFIIVECIQHAVSNGRHLDEKLL